MSKDIFHFGSKRLGPGAWYDPFEPARAVSSSHVASCSFLLSHEATEEVFSKRRSFYSFQTAEGTPSKNKEKESAPTNGVLTNCACCPTRDLRRSPTFERARHEASLLVFKL